MAYVMQVLARADGAMPFDVPTFLQAHYDTGELLNVGTVVWTEDVRKAKRYATQEDAWRHYTHVSTVAPVRPYDGQPNKPLCAWSVLVAPEEDYL